MTLAITNVEVIGEDGVKLSLNNGAQSCKITVFDKAFAKVAKNNPESITAMKLHGENVNTRYYFTIKNPKTGKEVTTIIIGTFPLFDL